MQGLWLVEKSAREALERARATITPTPEQLANYEQRVEAVSAAAGDAPRPPRGVQVEGATAKISVTGVLTKRPDFWAWLLGMGNTTYSSIIAGIAYAEERPDIDDIEFLVDSPGGQVDGLFETIAAIQAANKPKRVSASLAASAAYAIAAAAGPITASSPSSTFGSIGVVATYYVDKDTVEITSTNAPAKRPDVRTAEGQAVVRAYLDELHDLFVDAIATGRGVDATVINKTFGQGAVFTAGEALRRKMIDGVARPKLRAVAAGNNNTPSAGEKVAAMDLKTLRAQHPELVAALLEEGAQEERDRVVGFLDLAEHAGEAGMKQAIKDIREGAKATPAKAMSYMGLALNKRDRDNHEADSKAAEQATTDAASGATPARDLGDILADALGAPQLKVS